jgi:septal ring factor EnvC (AmiA/AmiB activator)
MGAKWFGLIVAALLVGAAPVMLYLRKYHVDHLANSRDEATAEVYETLRQQIRYHGDQIHRLNEERAVLQAESLNLRARILELESKEQQLQRLKAQLDESDALNVRLKEKLDCKDEVMEKLAGENRQLIAEILSLKDRVHELELRLSRDENLIDRSLVPGGHSFGPGRVPFAGS